MEGEVPDKTSEKTGAVSYNLLPTHSEKTIKSMKATYAAKRITFDRSEANPGDTLDVNVPKLNENEVFVPGSLALRFDIDLSGGHHNNFLVQNVSRALVSQLLVKFGGTTLDDTVDYDMYKIFTDPFLPVEKRDNMVPEGIQSEDLCKIRSGSGDKKTTVVDGRLTDHSIFHPQALYTDLVFEVTLAPVSQVVKGSDPTKLKYKLTKIELEYEMIRSEQLANEAASTYTNGKEFLYDQVNSFIVLPTDKTRPLINIKVDYHGRPISGINLETKEGVKMYYAPSSLYWNLNNRQSQTNFIKFEGMLTSEKGYEYPVFKFFFFSPDILFLKSIIILQFFFIYVYTCVLIIDLI